MTSLLLEYEQQYSVITAEITSNIGRLGAVSIDDRRNLIVEINRGIDEAQELLEQIGLEINQNVDSTQRASQQTRLKSYHAELKRLEEDYNKAKIKPNPLLVDDSSSIDDFDIGISEDQKRRLLDNSERLERTGNQLQEGYRIAIETEEIGTQVLQNLHNQRETIQRSRNRLRETNADLGRSSRLMNMMIMRGLRDKFALYIIAVVFVIAITLTIYFSIK
ncbi:hypothetical protein PVAND_005247 [Polypedilum vanderplanki]|uniref:Vesicle transport through interaction with t-SNAREs homolog 1A n=1 Tax=Polypedilum vanderplanki TaxID=319348 RepID=A0A9J6BZD0_POLVA|nr:hypothetical protein PVAND_005247 [Polypedilum vanderplanki]